MVTKHSTEAMQEETYQRGFKAGVEAAARLWSSYSLEATRIRALLPEAEGAREECAACAPGTKCDQPLTDEEAQDLADQWPPASPEAGGARRGICTCMALIGDNDDCPRHSGGPGKHAPYYGLPTPAQSVEPVGACQCCSVECQEPGCRCAPNPDTTKG